VFYAFIIVKFLNLQDINVQSMRVEQNFANLPMEIVVIYFFILLATVIYSQIAFS